MREIRPYQTALGARKALDNGGRFYNLFARANDSVVESAELARAAGSTSADTRAYLYIEMALMHLNPAERAEGVTLLSPRLRQRYEARRPQLLKPSAVKQAGEVGTPAVITGYPVHVEHTSQFEGFIIMVVPIIMLIPIVDQFDVYEVYDTEELVEPRTVMATARGSKRLDGVRGRFGGVLKTLTFEGKPPTEHGMYLEGLYYTPLP